MKQLRHLALAVSLALGACGNAPSKDQCDQLLDHLIDLEIQKGGGKNVTDDMKADLVKQKKAVADLARDKFSEACVKKTPKKVVECGLTARNGDEVLKCDEAK